MGALPILFTIALSVVCGLYYQFHAAKRVKRRGAIYHVHRQLGHSIYEGIEDELASIVHERTEPSNLKYEAVIARSALMDRPTGRYDREKLIAEMVAMGQERFGLDRDFIQGVFEGERMEVHAIRPQMYLAYKTIAEAEQSELFIFRFGDDAVVDILGAENVHTLMYMVMPQEPAGLDLRVVGHLAEMAQAEDFEKRWLAARNEQEINRVLMRDDHYLHEPIAEIPALKNAAGTRLEAIDLPGSCQIVMVERDGNAILSRPDLELEAGDRVSVLGEPEDLRALFEDGAVGSE